MRNGSVGLGLGVSVSSDVKVGLASLAVFVASSVLVADGASVFSLSAGVGDSVVPFSLGVMVGTKVGVSVLGTGVKVGLGVLTATVGLVPSWASFGAVVLQPSKGIRIRTIARIRVALCIILVSF
jgi:hypothetical protein